MGPDDETMNALYPPELAEATYRVVQKEDEDSCISCSRCRWSLGAKYKLATCPKYPTYQDSKPSSVYFKGSPCPHFLPRGKTEDYATIGIGKFDARDISDVSPSVLPALKSKLGAQAFYWHDVAFHTTPRTADNFREIYKAQVDRKDDFLYGGDKSVLNSMIEDVLFLYPPGDSRIVKDSFCGTHNKQSTGEADFITPCTIRDLGLARQFNEDWGFSRFSGSMDRLHIVADSVDELVAVWQVLESPSKFSFRRNARIAFMREFDGVQFWVTLYPPFYFGHFVVKFHAVIRS